MKRNKLLIFVFIMGLSFSRILAQTAFYDASELKKVCGNSPVISSGNTNAIEILGKYVNSNNDKEIIRAFKNNPFIKMDTTGWRNEGANLLDISRNRMPEIGGLNITTLADGLARFLVERTKEELNIAFFEKFEDFMDKNEDIRILFPKTSAILLKIGDEIYIYSVFIPLLREAFYSDLNETTVNFANWLDCANCKSNQLKADQKSILKLVLFLVNHINSGLHPGQILHELTTINGFQDLDKDIRASLLTADLFSQSLRSKDFEFYWITAKDLENFTDPVFSKLYFGLIYQQAEKIEFTTKSLRTVLDRYAENINDAGVFVHLIYQELAQIDQNLSPGNKNNNKVSINNYFTIGQKTGQFIELMYTHLINKEDQNVAIIAQYNYYVLHLSELMADIRSNALNSAVFETYLLLDTLIRDEGRKGFLKGFLKYATFMASVSSARDSKEVQAAIESVALPAGSSRIKRETACNISLNAYPGLFGGYEQISKIDKSFKLNAYGITAPVGFAFSKGNSFLFVTTRCRWSTSVFISLIDIGAVAAFRFKNDSIDQVPTIQLKDIVSPGLFLSFGIPKLPISVNVGAQIGSNLRRVESTVANYSKNMYVRYSVSLTVDIPILNLYTKSEN
jgi:hypothetical protein